MRQATYDALASTKRNVFEKTTKTILIADDDPDDLLLFQETLQAEGYHVLTTTDGEEAIRMAGHVKPDLIILDIVMPRLYGSEAGIMLHDNPATRNIPIVFLTALKQPDDNVTPLGQAHNIVLAKSHNPRELLNTIHELIG